MAYFGERASFPWWRGSTDGYSLWPKNIIVSYFIYMETKYKLGHSRAKKTHKQIVSHLNSYSLTMTLKPYYNSLPAYEQYRLYSNELRNLLIKMNRYYNIIMSTPEFTKEYNLHYHLYFILPDEMDIQTFEQNLKKFMLKRGVIGRNYKLKKIDEVTEKLINYPFKDLERTNKFSNIQGCLFTPYHSIINGLNPWKII